MAEYAAMEQIKGFYEKLTKVQKIIIGSVLGVIIISLATLIFSSTDKEFSVLYSQLEPQDASQIIEKLKEKQFDYELKDEGSTILIEKSKVYQTRLDLAAEGLPETSVVGYEIFDKTNLGMSEFVQKLNYRRALEGELSRTITNMDEITKARVHIVIPEKVLFKKDQKDPTASITLSLRSGRSISRLNVEGIQNLVAGSVEGMEPDNVMIVDQRGRVLSEKKSDKSTIAGLTATQYEQQMNVEKYLSGKVQSMLDGVLGPGNSEVRVNADLDFTQIERTITDFDPERQVERSTQAIEDKTSKVDSVTNSYFNLNDNTKDRSSTPMLNKDEKSKSNIITNYEVSKKVERIVEGVGNIKRLSVAVMVNGTLDVVEKEGDKSLEYSPREKEEMEKLEQIIKKSVGFDPDRDDQVSVINVPFDTVIQEKDINDFYRQPWYEMPEYQKLLLLILAMAVTIFIMYKILRSKQVKDRLRIAFNLPDKIELEEEEEEEDLEEIQLDDEELLLMPAELPEQLLLESEKADKALGLPEEEIIESGDGGSLASKAQAKLEETPEMTEEALMKLEIKEKVQKYMDSDTEEAVKLVKMLLSQDVIESASGFNF